MDAALPPSFSFLDGHFVSFARYHDMGDDPCLFKASTRYFDDKSLNRHRSRRPRPCLVYPKTKKFSKFPSHRILRYIHEALNIDENKANRTVCL